MLTFALGALLGWFVTGLCDYYATKRVYARAFEAGQTAALRQVSGW